MFRSIGLIFWKEITEARRDKRAMLMVLFIGIFMPASMLGGVYVQTIFQNKADRTVYYVEGAEYAPALVRFLHAEGLRTVDNSDTASVWLKVPEDYQSQMQTGYLPTLTIQADVSNNSGAVRRLRSALGGYSQRVAIQRLMERGVSPIVARPFIVDVDDSSGVSLLARFFAPFFIVMILMAPMYAVLPAGIDCLAGERERHSLFPMLLLPVPTIYLPLGKLLMLVVSGLVALALAIASGFIAYSNVSLKGFNFEFDMSLYTGILFLIFSIPLVFMLSALVMGFSSFAKSFKEGQTYAGLGGLVPFALVGIGFVFDESWRPFMPIWAEVTVLTDVLSGKAITLMPWLASAMGYGAFVALCMVWISITMRRNALAANS